MRLCVTIVLSLFVSLLTETPAVAQQAAKSFDDSLAKKFEYYRNAQTGSVLYAHFDKTIYTNNENVWFTAYLLKSARPGLNNVLSALLIRNSDRSAALKARFVMANGIAFGNFFLPDSIRDGDYSFLLYTSELYAGKPANTFVQPVAIKNTSGASFNASLFMPDTAEQNGSRKVTLVTNAPGTRIIAGAEISYTVGNGLQPLISGAAKTDRAGQYVFLIPMRNVRLGRNLFEARITYQKEMRTVKMLLPAAKEKPSLKFFPEGGNLTNDVLATVAFEAKNGDGSPLKASWLLYSNGKPADTIYSDSYGMGRFRLIPAANNLYTVKPLSPAADTLFYLPKALPGLPEIAIGNAVAGDTLHLLIRTKEKQKIYVIVHNYRDLFYSFQTEVASGTKPMIVMLDSLPRGIAEVTVLDSLHRPCAERLFFAHYDRKNELDIQTDTTTYRKRQKITLTLNLKDPDRKPIPGLVSIACVQANRLEIKRRTDIESYFYLNNMLGVLPEKKRYMGTSEGDREYLENILLVKGWRRYTWTGLVKSEAKDTLKQPDAVTYHGSVTDYDRPLKKPKSLIEIKDSLITPLNTDSKGFFNVKPDSLYTQQNRKITFVANGQTGSGVAVAVTDPFDKVDRDVAASYLPKNFTSFKFNPASSDDSGLPGDEHVIYLKQVNIKDRRDNQFYSGTGWPSVDGCDDYVCVFNILNCPNHRHDGRNRQPVIGETYIYQGKEIFYTGCVVPIIKPTGLYTQIDGINYAVEFYPADYAKVNPSSPEYLSTIYWNHLVKLSASNPGKISFYTGDITGEFKIIVQGISTTGLVYGEKSFAVIP